MVNWENIKLTKQVNLIDELPPNALFFPLMDHIKKVVANYPPKTILDIGCGQGYDSKYFMDLGHKVISCDISFLRLAEAKNVIHSNWNLAQGSAVAMPIKNGSVDVVFANSVLLFVNPDEFVKECERILKPGGELILARESLPDNLLLKFARTLEMYYQCTDYAEREKFAKRLSLNDLQKLFSRHFNVRECMVYSYSSIPAYVLFMVLNKLFRGKANPELRNYGIFHRIDRFLFDKLPFLKKKAWVAFMILQKVPTV